MPSGHGRKIAAPWHMKTPRQQKLAAKPASLFPDKAPFVIHPRITTHSSVYITCFCGYA